MRKVIAVVAVLALTGCATSAQKAERAAEAQASAAALAAESSGELVCVNQRVTGSRHPQKTCYTRQEMTLMKERGQDVVRDLQRGSQPLPREGG